LPIAAAFLQILPQNNMNACRFANKLVRFFFFQQPLSAPGTKVSAS